MVLQQLLHSRVGMRMVMKRDGLLGLGLALLVVHEYTNEMDDD